jgi:hypothetical protein
MTRNVGTIDRVIRAVVGAALIAAFFFLPDLQWRWAFWVGLLPLATAAAGWCPVYRLFGRRGTGDGGPAATA